MEMQIKQEPEAQDYKINDRNAWQAFRVRWKHMASDTAHAYALKAFDADDQVPLSKHLLLVCIVGFFVLFIVWANIATLDEVTRGEGKIIPDSEVQALQSLDSGIVDAFLVREGETVSPGQVLIRLRDVEASSDLGATKARYYGLRASMARLQALANEEETLAFDAEIKVQAPQTTQEEQNTFMAQKQRLHGQLAVLEQQYKQRQQEKEELVARLEDLAAVIALQEQERDMIAPLVEKGSAPQLELLQLQRALQQSVNERNSLETSLPRIGSSIEEAKARLTDTRQGFMAEVQGELATKTLELQEITERLSGLEERKVRREIKSPVAGVVQELTVNTVGGVVRAGEDVVRIVPKDDQLIIEALIKPSDRAFLYPGQKAIVKITAYDFSIYGGLPAELVDISADTIKDEQGQFFYRLRVRTHENELKRKGEVLPILPGMMTGVDILTGQKTVMQYLLKPFIKTLSNAMKER